MSKAYVSLTKSERSIVIAAAQIYSAYIQSGAVREGTEDTWMQRSVREAVRLAQLADGAVVSDGETS